MFFFGKQISRKVNVEALLTEMPKKISDIIAEYDAFSPAEELFEYIQNNKLLARALSEVKSQGENLIKLNTAIVKGDLSDAIFFNENCHVYLLFLIKEEKIPFWRGMTLYMYLIALMQYTSLQPLHKEDMDEKKGFKQLRSVQACFLAQNQMLTSVGENFVNTIVAQFKDKIDVILSIDLLKKFIIELPPIDNMVLKIQHTPLIDSHSEQLMKILLNNVPVIYSLHGNKLFTPDYYFPSFAIINFLFQFISDKPLTMQPMFGLVAQDTLFSLHKKGRHPVALYSPHVKTRLIEVDGFRCGPFPALIHDIGHAVWGSLLPDHQILFAEIIPQLENMKEKLIDEKDKLFLNKIIGRLIDFNLTPISSYKELEHRFFNYLLNCFHRGLGFLYPGEPSVKGENIGECIEDKIYLMINLLTRDPAISGRARYLWECISDVIYKRSHHYLREDDIIDAIRAFRHYRSQNCYMHQCQHIDWAAWVKMLESNLSNDELWKKILYKHHNDLLRLQQNYVIKFFPPILPITDDLRLDLANKIKDFNKPTPGKSYRW